jgi:uncharacterized protein
MYDRMLKLPLTGDVSLFLFGPRGTGKTTWIKNFLPSAIYIDLLEFQLYKKFSSDPGRLEEHIPKTFTAGSDWIVIDEVQKVPELLNEVHRLIEKYHYKFLLTGSSARSLKRKGVNLLAGRALHYHMHPFVVQELQDSFDLYRALQFGLLPMAVTQENPQKYLDAYVHTYLQEEVMQEGLTRNISAFTRFLEVASFSQGSLINASEIAREVGIARQVINDYFEILESLLIAYRIEPFTRRAKRRTMLHPKFYFFDAGVYRTLRPKGPLDTNDELDGASLETIFLQSLKAINDYQELGYNIYFWRTSSGHEVDFVIYGERGLHAFEIKRSGNITRKSLRGLIAFQKDFPEAKLHLLYLGNRREYHQEIAVIPFLDGLKELSKIIQ